MAASPLQTFSVCCSTTGSKTLVSPICAASNADAKLAISSARAVASIAADSSEELYSKMPGGAEPAEAPEFRKDGVKFVIYPVIYQGDCTQAINFVV